MLYIDIQDLNIYILNMCLSTHTYIYLLYCSKPKLQQIFFIQRNEEQLE